MMKIFLAIILIASSVCAKNVTMDLAFGIGGKSANIIHANGTDFDATISYDISFNTLAEKFMSAEKNGAIFVYVFAGSDFRGARINTDYSSSAYLLSMTQGSDNLYLIGFTNGTYLDISKSTQNFYRIVPKTLGSVILLIQGNYALFMRLQVPYDIENNITFRGNTKLYVKNTGSSTKPVINMEVK